MARTIRFGVVPPAAAQGIPTMQRQADVLRAAA